MLDKKIFISYRSLDAEIARALARCVESVGGSVYLDERDPELDVIGVGATSRRQSLMETIFQGLRSSDTLMAVITRRTRGSWWVPAEVSAALQMGKEVALVCESGVRPPDFDVHAVIDSQERLVSWLGSGASQMLDSKASRILDLELFSYKADDVRQASVHALQKIESLWDPSSWSDLELEEPRYAHNGKWMGCRSSRLISTLYAVTLPIFLYKRTAPRLDRSELEREVAAILYESWTDDESLAATSPQILYEARKCRDWKSLRDQNPQRYWLQGMKPKDIDSLFDEISSADGSPLDEKEFSELYLSRYNGAGTSQKPLGLAANSLQGFTLDARPVFARVLAVHARVHCALLRLDEAGGVASVAVERLFDLSSSSLLLKTDPAVVSLAYLLRKFAPRMRELCPRKERAANG